MSPNRLGCRPMHAFALRLQPREANEVRPPKHTLSLAKLRLVDEAVHEYSWASKPPRSTGLNDGGSSFRASATLSARMIVPSEWS